MNREIIKRAGEIVQQNTGAGTYCILALIDENGYPTASTITAAKAEGIDRVFFGTGLAGNKAKRIEKANRAAVCFNTGGEYNITLVGTIEIITDPATKRAMWYAGLENHFSGADDPAYCVLCFRTERYNLLVDWKEAGGML